MHYPDNWWTILMIRHDCIAIQNPVEGANTKGWITIIRQPQNRDVEFLKVTERRMLFTGWSVLSEKREEVLEWSYRGDIKRGDIRLRLMHFGMDKVIGFMNRYFYGFNIQKLVRDVITVVWDVYGNHALYKSNILTEQAGIIIQYIRIRERTRERYLLVLIDYFSKY